MSDAVVIVAIVGAFASVATAIVGGIVAVQVASLNLKTAQAADAANDAAEKAAEVKLTVRETSQAAAREVARVREALAVTTKAQDEKLEGIAKTGQDTLMHVNRQRGESLKLLAEVSRWKADQTGADADVVAADLAEKNLAEHMKGQADVDAQKGQPAKVPAPGTVP